MERAFKKLFDDCVDHYATERERLPYFRAQIEIMLSMLARERAGTVLDIGCAAGSEIPALRSLGHKVIGADLSEKMLQSCCERFAGDQAVQVLCAEADRIPLAADSVDHVVCLGVFEYLRDYSPALKEIARVLRSGGVLVLAIPRALSVYNITERAVEATIAPLWRAVRRRGGGRQNGSPDTPRTNFCLPGRLRKLLREHCLRPERDAYTNYFLYPLDRFPALDVKVAAALEPLARVPLLRLGASVYIVCARKEPAGHVIGRTESGRSQ